MTPRPELMARALAEAARARGRTRPNPMVGCVVSRGGRIVAVGHHTRAGAAHAEVAALRRAGAAARGADVYVTLEPCDHEGRTGRCTDALVAAGVGRVFVGTRDPNPRVDGRGIRRLRRAGIAVHVGCLGAACRRLNEAFELSMRRGRPLVVAKLAQSLDGKVATATGASQWITGPAARRLGHGLRNELDAIVVGVGTVLADDPRLTCRLRGGRDPVRVVLDSWARTPPRARLLAGVDGSAAPTYVCVTARAPAARQAALRRAGAEVVVCGDGARCELGAVLAALRARDILSVLVEGGPTVTGSFFDAGLVDRLVAFVAPLVLGGVGAPGAVGGAGVAALTAAHRLRHVRLAPAGPDWVLRADLEAR